MLFREIIGQEDLKRHLSTMVDSGRIAHAQLYTGKTGTGKLPLAIATAQYILCKNRHNGESCGECTSCRQFSKLEHPDLHFVFPISKSGENGAATCNDAVGKFKETILANPYTTLDDWMTTVSGGKQCLIYASESEEIIRKLSFKPYEGDYKVMIIWGADKMNEVCANKVLKILEEPPGDTIFMLISDTTDKMLTTITSRCQQITVPPITTDRLATEIRIRYSADDDEVEFLSRNAMGSWGRLQQLMNESEEMSQHFELFKDMMRISFACDIKRLKQWSEQMAQMSRDSEIRFLQKAQQLLRENFFVRLGQPTLNYMNHEEEEFSRRFANFIHEHNVTEIMDEFTAAEMQIAQNGNAKIIFFHLGIVLYTLLRRSR